MSEEERSDDLKDMINEKVCDGAMCKYRDEFSRMNGILSYNEAILTEIKAIS